MDYDSGTNVPGFSRSADDIADYARIARKREEMEFKREAAERKRAAAEMRQAEIQRRDEEREQRRQEQAQVKRVKEAVAAASRAQKAAAEKTKQDQEAKQEAMVREAAGEFVENLHFVAKLDRYLERVDNEWVYLKYEALRKQHAEFMIDGFAKAFHEAMSDSGHTFTSCTYSTAAVPPNVMNLMDQSQWVQPIEGQHHFLFDLLMRSLGGNKAENIEHLEHVIYWKWRHPECFMLPCIVIHGEGGTGKNLLMDRTLYTLFPRQTISATADHITGNFNGLLVGMMAALINENMNERGDMNALKDMLHKPRLTVNIKNVPQFTADNTALYFVGVNFDSGGGVQLDRSDADRRISVLFCERGKTLLYWVAKHQGWSMDEARTWMVQYGHDIAGDPVEVGKWLHSLHTKYQDREQPHALHGADFKELLNEQKRLDERLFEAVFNDPQFHHIERKVLYAGYRAICREENQRYAYGKSKFYNRAEAWLNIHHPAIKERTISGHREKRQSLYLYTAEDNDIEIDNSHLYVTGADPSHAIWQGPELH